MLTFNGIIWMLVAVSSAYDMTKFKEERKKLKEQLCNKFRLPLFEPDNDNGACWVTRNYLYRKMKRLRSFSSLT